MTRQLFGIVGSVDDVSAMKREWNAYFAKQEMDAFMDSYPTKEEELPERLSEMFHFDRRGYIVGKSLQKAIIPLLDSLDSSVGEGSVDTVTNTDGVLNGSWTGGDNDQRKTLWLLNTISLQ
ncbi:hypothetical protein H6770_04170 [Candidatus Peribacteria bacterium]|nr:hypothetical protein [Candidatus Peribacteria bacterium]